jgi:ketosteroid isomerase-like protein
MTADNVEENRALALRFIESLNTRNIDVMEDLLHPDFVWNTAVTSDNHPNRLRPMQSKGLQGKNLPHAKPRLNRDESLAVFRAMFKGHYRDVMSEDGTAGERPPVEQVEHHMRLDVLGTTAEADRVAMEAESHVLNPENGRLYNNFYHYLFRVRAGKLTLFKEYQDTLHLYDFVSE